MPSVPSPSRDRRQLGLPAGWHPQTAVPYRAIGIDICESDVWGNGVGTNALRAFINYYFGNGVDELYTQTWSGNIRMLRCAEKLGFEECNRYVGSRQVEGKTYDGLTFRLEKR